MLLCSVAAFGQPAFEPLGMLPTATRSNAWGISGDGSTVVGYSREMELSPYIVAVRWTGQGLQPLVQLPVSSSSSAYATSFDGSVIVGTMGAPAFRWTATGGIESLGALPGVPYCFALAVSADGTVVVGACNNVGIGRSFRWTAATGMVDLGTVQNQPHVQAQAVSADGTVIAGSIGNTLPGTLGFRWTATSGIEVLPPLPGSSQCGISGISGDGEVLVGSCMLPVGRRAFRWTAQTGTVALGAIEDSPSFAMAANWDGSVIVGYSIVLDGGWVWSAQTGMVRVSSLLPGVVPASNIILGVYGVSYDGRRVAGDFENPLGMYEAFVATLAWDPCYANCDGSTTPPALNVDDFTCFINEFAAAQTLPPSQQITHYANCDGSTITPVLNVDDFTCFINAFAQGCP